MKKVLLIVSFVALASCSGGTTALSTTAVPNASLTTSIDCSGFQSNLLIPYGINTPTGQALAGQVFAKVVAVDSMDGTMKVTIVPPDGSSAFATSLLDQITAQGYTIRIIACRENPSSVVSGYTTTGVCSSTGPINLVGSTTVTSANFLSSGFTVGGITVHATSTGTGTIRPNFIMITAGGLVEQNQVGEFMLAFGTSPYYNGCYSQ